MFLAGYTVLKSTRITNRSRCRDLRRGLSGGADDAVLRPGGVLDDEKSPVCAHDLVGGADHGHGNRGDLARAVERFHRRTGDDADPIR